MRAESPLSGCRQPNSGPDPAAAPPKRRLLRRRREGPKWFERTRTNYPWLDPVVKWAVATVGVLLIVGGAVIAPLPGPGGFIAFFGIALLATEFRWVRKLTRQSQAVGHRWSAKLTGKRPKWAWRWKKKMSAATSRVSTGEAA